MNPKNNPENKNSFPDKQRGSLRVDGYLPLWFHHVKPADLNKIRSQIADYAVQRHAIAGEEKDRNHPDPDFQLILREIAGLRKSFRQYFEQSRLSERRTYSNCELTLTATGCVLHHFDAKPILHPGDWMALGMLLPTHPLEVFVLGSVLRVEQGPQVVIAFDNLAPDQEDWIIQYLILREQEDIRQKHKQEMG